MHYDFFRRTQHVGASINLLVLVHGLIETVGIRPAVHTNFDQTFLLKSETRAEGHDDTRGEG